MDAQDDMDYTLELPDELIEMIFWNLPYKTIFQQICEKVCRRWKTIAQRVFHAQYLKKWKAYEACAIEPKQLKLHGRTLTTLAMGSNGNIYTGSPDCTIRVWSDGSCIKSMHGTTSIYELAMGDDAVYSLSDNDDIQKWYVAGDAWLLDAKFHLDTSDTNTCVSAIAVGLDGKIYTGGSNGSIYVWTTDDTHSLLQTLRGHTGVIDALHVDRNGQLYSGSGDTTIRVWSGVDSRQLYILQGHTEIVCHITTGNDGLIYSASGDTTIRIWLDCGGAFGAHFGTLKGHKGIVWSVAVDLYGTIFSVADDETLRVWSGVDWRLMYTCQSCTWNIVAGIDGNIYTDASDEALQIW